MNENRSNCPQTTEIEAFALGLHVNNEALKSHIKGCASCRALLSAYQEFYQCFEQVDESSILEPAHQIIQKRSRLYPLKPLQPAVHTDQLKLRLAAKTVGTGYTFIRGFVNETEDIVARLMRNDSKAEFILYLIAPPEKLKQNYLVQIQGLKQTWLSDETGVVHLGKLHASEVVDAAIQLRSPQAVFQLDPLKDSDKKAIASGTFMIENPASEKIIIHIDDSQGKRLYQIKIDQVTGLDAQAKVHVSVHQAGYCHLRPAVNGIAVFENLNEEKALQVKIY